MTKELIIAAMALVDSDKGLIAMDDSARAIQQPALEIWQGKEENVFAAQQALFHRAKCNHAARRGDYSDTMEGT